MIEYVAAPGDCLASIAAQFKQTIEAIWDLPDNAALREARPDLYVLAAGDRVWVPEPSHKRVVVPTGARHVFERRATHCEFSVQMLLNGKPRSHEPYVLVVGDERIEGTTDADGLLVALIPADAHTGVIELDDGHEQRPIRFGDLDPIETPRGVQARLADLAYYFEAVDGDIGPYTTQAIRAFQLDQGLDASGMLDDATRDALRIAYGR